MSNNIKIARLSLIMHSRIITSNFPTFLFTNIRVRRVCPLLTREGALAGATRMTREREREREVARGGYSCIGEVTVSGNRVRAGASGTRRRSVTRPTDPLTRLTLSLSRPLRAAPFSVAATAAAADTVPRLPGKYRRITSRFVSPYDSRAGGVMARRYANAITRLRERDHGPDCRYSL